MHVPSLSGFRTFVELREFVYRILCQQEQLDVGAFPSQERLIHRHGNPCGVIFTVYGPRRVVSNAIWETEQNTVYFYASSGERFRSLQLQKSPPIDHFSKE